MDIEERVGKLEYELEKQSRLNKEYSEKFEKLEAGLIKLGKNLLKNLKNFDNINDKLGTASIKATDIDMSEIISEVKMTVEEALKDLDNKSVEVTLKDIDLEKMSDLVAEQLLLKKDTENPTPKIEKEKKVNVKSVSIFSLVFLAIIGGSLFFYHKSNTQEQYKTVLPVNIKVYSDDGKFVGNNKEERQIFVVVKDTNLYFDINEQRYFVKIKDMQKFYKTK